MSEVDYTISVRQLIEFIMRAGDIIVSDKPSPKRALEGARIHRMLQSEYHDMDEKEVSLQKIFIRNGYRIMIQGRADGIQQRIDGTIIDEIKSVSIPLSEIDQESSPLHWAQGMWYAYLYSEQNNLKEIYVQLTYYCTLDNNRKSFRKQFTFMELERFVFEQLEAFAPWVQWNIEAQKKSMESLKDVEFPFEEYRTGQRNLMKAVFKTLKDKQFLYADAPTGIGKTLSTLYPALKFLGNDGGEKIFYLTAKNATSKVVYEALSLLKEKKLYLPNIFLTAKEKVCLQEKVDCRPQVCPYASGHFDRVNQALWEIIHKDDMWSKEKIENIAQKYTVCPFELALDLTDFATLVIGDYNYVFDPRAGLKRHMESVKSHVFLIDEAHNLVDRARQMYSAEIMKMDISGLRKTLVKKKVKCKRELGKLEKLFPSKEQIASTIQKEDEISPLFITQIEKTLEALEYDFGQGFDSEEGTTLYFELLNFVKITELFGEGFIFYWEKNNNGIKAKIFCLDPSKQIKNRIGKSKGAIFFSATLQPMHYYVSLLGGDEKSYKYKLGSPFPRKNREIIIMPFVKTYYSVRESSYPVIVEAILEWTGTKCGNYLVFFPSYSYMLSVAELLEPLLLERKIRFQVQSLDMNEENREEYLNQFKEKPQESLVSFAVLGGIFSEGINLLGDRVIGVSIIGVGLPQINEEGEMLRVYFEKKYGDGFEYAYTYPGMNKVLQAAGRLIRSEEDRGSIILMDDRYLTNRYQNLFPEEWLDYEVANSLEKMVTKVCNLWNSR